MSYSTFEYTKSYAPDSSLIDAVYFNENNSTAILDVNDELYRYVGVDQNDVSELVDGDEYGSVGAYYNRTFKPKFGPAEHLGHYSEFEASRVAVTKNNDTPTTPKGLVDAGETKEYSLAPATVFESELDAARVDNVNAVYAVNDTSATREYSLTSPIKNNSESSLGEVDIIVHFSLDDFDAEYTYEANDSDTVEGAIGELNSFVSRMGARGRVRKVVVNFE